MRFLFRQSTSTVSLDVCGVLADGDGGTVGLDVCGITGVVAGWVGGTMGLYWC